MTAYKIEIPYLNKFVLRYISLAIVAAAWIWASYSHPYSNSPVIRSDGVGYHMWTKAFRSGDFSFIKNRHAIDFPCTIAPGKDDVCINKYPAGTAMLRYPFIWPAVNADTALLYSPAEEEFVHWFGGVLLLISGWLLLNAVAKLGYSGIVPNFCLLVVIFGTSWFHYSTYDSSFSHTYSALWVSVLIWCSVFSLKLRPDASIRKRYLLFVLLILDGLMLVLTRNTNIFVVAAGSAALLWISAIRAKKIEWNLAEPCTLVMGTITGIALQILYNHYASGQYTISSYSAGGESFDFSNPMQASVLFSYERGLFTYYPALAIILLSSLSTRIGRISALPAVVVTAAGVGLYGFWHVWFLGGGFGHRGFAEFAPLYFIPAVMGIEGASGKAKRIALFATYAVLVGFTVRMMWLYWLQVIPFMGCTRDNFWSALFR